MNEPKDADDIAANKEIETILNLLDAIRRKHPNAKKPDTSGEPDWAAMYGDDDDESEDIPDMGGEIICPACECLVRYRISSYNGHIHAACGNHDCYVRWMQ